MINLDWLFNWLKSIFSKPYIEELTVFIKVKIPNLKASSKAKPKIVRNDVIKKREKTKIKTDKKYLLISFCSTIVSVK